MRIGEISPRPNRHCCERSEWEKAGSRYRDHLIQCISNRVSVYLDGGDTESAERLLRSRLPAPGATPEPAAAGLLYHLGALDFAQGRYEEAIQIAEQAAELWRPVVGPHDPALASIYNMIGMACFQKRAERKRPSATSSIAWKFWTELQSRSYCPRSWLTSGTPLPNFAAMRKRTGLWPGRALSWSERSDRRNPALAVALQIEPVLRKLGHKAEAKQADRIAKAILQARPPRPMRANTVDVTEFAKSASPAR